MGDGGESEYGSPSSPRSRCREKIKNLERDRVNGKGGKGAASSSAPTKRCCRGACSRSHSPKATEVVQQSGRAPVFGPGETSDPAFGTVTHLDRGKGKIAVEDVGEECSDEAPEDSDVNVENPDSRVPERSRDKKKNRAETKGIRFRREKSSVEMRVAVSKQRLLGFGCISLGAYDTREEAILARNVGNLYCGNGPSVPAWVSSLLPLDELNKLPPKEKEEHIRRRREHIRGIAREATQESTSSVPSCHPGRFYAAALVPQPKASPTHATHSLCGLPQQTEIDGCSHVESDVQDEAQEAIVLVAPDVVQRNAEASVPPPKTSTYTTHSLSTPQQVEIESYSHVEPDMQDQAQRPVLSPKITSTHVTHSLCSLQQVEIEADSQTLEARLEATTDVIEDQEHCGWDVDNALIDPNANESLDFYSAIDSGSSRNMDLDHVIKNGARFGSDWKHNLPMSDSAITHNSVQES